ncbi:hypothetical protein PFISCL1PPCAC_21921, partial [Pristionchus fissidentatus]
FQMDLDDENSFNSTFYNASEPHRGETSMYLPQLRRYSRHLLPLFCFVGIGGNCMALMLMRTNFWLRRLTSNIYLCTLSVCGCLFLSTVLVTWADNVYDLPLYSSNEVGCKVFTFLAHFCDFICVWMITWTSCDRMIVLYRPGIRKWILTKWFARNLTISTTVAAITLYGWCLLFAGLEVQDDKQYCGLKGNSTLFGYTYNAKTLYIHLTMVDTIICTVVPSVLIMVVNCFSTYRYRQCMKIYASGVLRVRFLREVKSDVPMADSVNARLLQGPISDAQ